MPGINFDAVVAAGMEAFGETHAYHPPGGTAFSVPGIFNRRHTAEKYDAKLEMQVAVTRTVLGVPLAAFAARGLAPVSKALVQADGQTWRVVDVEADGVAHALLILKAEGAGA